MTAPGSALNDHWSEVGELIATLYRTVGRLEALFPGRRFTMDGHLVGSIGEVIAAHMFGLELLPASAEKHDACAPDGRLLQIKFTQGKRAIAMYGEPEHMIALRLTPLRTIEVLYNGPGAVAWNASGKLQKNGQRSISLSRLRSLDKAVPLAARLPVVDVVLLDGGV